MPDHNYIVDNFCGYFLLTIDPTTNTVVKADSTPVAQKMVGMSKGAVRAICRRGILYKSWLNRIEIVQAKGWRNWRKNAIKDSTL